jgi:polyglycine hydrolase-like protein
MRWVADSPYLGRVVDFVAYHDRTSADHQAHFDDLYPKGWRMTSLTVYGRLGSSQGPHALSGRSPCSRKSLVDGK